MPDVTVIADDLTGAADCGIAFAAAGLPTFVAFGAGADPGDARAVAVDTDTRRLPVEQAIARALDAARDACRRGVRVLYKKIDSTLRGHVGAEVAAMLRAVLEEECGASPPLAVVAPAFPGTGRTTRGGRVLVGGVALEDTEIWRGAGIGGPADLAAMLAAAGISAQPVGLDAVRSGADALARTLELLADRGFQAAICDADEEGDLARIAEAGARLARRVGWVGSGGLARHLPRALGLAAGGAGSAARAVGVPRVDGPVLAVVGSRSAVAQAQVEALAAVPGTALVTAGRDALLARSGERAAALGALRSALGAGRDAVLWFRGGTFERAREAAFAAALGDLAAEAGAIGGLVATGGDTARAALLARGARGLHLLGEVEPGVPLGIADASPPLPAATKAGAFGTAATLDRARRALHGLRAAGHGAGREGADLGSA